MPRYKSLREQPDPRAMSNEPAILAEIIEALGSTPRTSGTWMVVTANSTQGTIGGGALEYRTIERAHEMIAAGERGPRLIELPLGPALSQCCGGYVRLRLSSAPAVDDLERRLACEKAVWPTIKLFGAGHVGRALVDALSPLPFRVDWIDGRAGEFPLTLADNIKKIITEKPATHVEDAPECAAILVMTHQHALDLAIVQRALEHGHRGFLGLIGSRTKLARFAKHLRSQGLDPGRITCPIGLAGIQGKQPAVIAASVAAQLLMISPPPQRGIR